MSDAVLFPTQIVVGKELEQKDHAWIKALSDKVQEQEMRELLERISHITHKFDRELADSVLEVSIRANRQVVEELRGGDKMCKALLEIMEPEINKIVEVEVNRIVEVEVNRIVEVEVQKEVEKERQKETRKSILNAIKSFRDLGISDKQMKELLVKNYELTPEEAVMYL